MDFIQSGPTRAGLWTNRLGMSVAMPFFILALAVFCMSWSYQAAAEDLPLRPTVLAGTWYPDKPQQLSDQIQKYLRLAKPGAVPGKMRAVIVPHAGHMYSGQVAAYSYSLLKGQEYETVVLVGPSHRAMFPGVSLDRRDYQTPLGRVPLDQALAKILLDRGMGQITARSEVHNMEHCLEIQLPFIQTVLPKAKIVPLLMGAQDLASCRALAQALANAVSGRTVLLLASTDLSHFHSSDQAKVMDQKLIDKVRAGDIEGLHQALSDGDVEACGGGPLVAVMLAAKTLGADQTTILKYAHSGEISGDNSKVVGYLAAAITDKKTVTRPDTNIMEKYRVVPEDAHLWSTLRLLNLLSPVAWAGQAPSGVNQGLSSEDQRRLLTIARETIMVTLDHKTYSLPLNLPDRLKANRGAFVTLKKHGELRGCIGRVTSDQPLAETVSSMAIKAAFQDPRFPALGKDELAGVSLEISVLTPFESVKDFKDIVVGRDGLVISRGYYQGLLLPQVPVEEGWNRDEFLEYTCQKAGLSPGCWKHPETKVFKFSAQVFSEPEQGKRK